MSQKIDVDERRRLFQQKSQSMIFHIRPTLVNIKDDTTRLDTPIRKPNKIQFPIATLNEIQAFLKINPDQRKQSPLDNRIQRFFMDKFSFFKQLESTVTIDILREIICELRLVTYEKNEILFHIGDIGRQMFMVLEGEVAILIPRKLDEIEESPSPQKSRRKGSLENMKIQGFDEMINQNFSKMKVVNIVKQYQDFGRVAIEHRVQRTATAIARDKTDLVALSFESFNKVRNQAFLEEQQRTISFLRLVPIFKHISLPALSILYSNSEVVKFTHHGIVFQEGDPANQIFIVQSGVLLIEKAITIMQTKQGKQAQEARLESIKGNENNHYQLIKVCLVGQGEIIGESEVLNAYAKDKFLFIKQKQVPNRVYRATVLEEASLLQLSAENLVQNCKQWSFENELLSMEQSKSQARFNLIENQLRFQTDSQNFINIEDFDLQENLQLKQSLKNQPQEQQDNNNKSALQEDTTQDQPQGFNFEELIINNLFGQNEYQTDPHERINSQQKQPINLNEKQVKHFKFDNSMQFNEELYEDLQKQYSFTIPFQNNPIAGDEQTRVSTLQFDNSKAPQNTKQPKIKQFNETNYFWKKDFFEDHLRIFDIQQTEPKFQIMLQLLQIKKKNIRKSLKTAQSSPQRETPLYIYASQTPNITELLQTNSKFATVETQPNTANVSEIQNIPKINEVQANEISNQSFLNQKSASMSQLSNGNISGSLLSPQDVTKPKLMLMFKKGSLSNTNSQTVNNTTVHTTRASNLEIGSKDNSISIRRTLTSHSTKRENTPSSSTKGFYQLNSVSNSPRVVGCETPVTADCDQKSKQDEILENEFLNLDEYFVNEQTSKQKLSSSSKLTSYQKYQNKNLILKETPKVYNLQINLVSPQTQTTRFFKQQISTAKRGDQNTPRNFSASHYQERSENFTSPKTNFINEFLNKYNRASSFKQFQPV